jgi:phage FluMu gp28-like protein
VKQKAWTQSLRPTLIDHQGKAIFISTPKGKNWFWELWMQGDDKAHVDWKSWRFTTFDNNHLIKKEIDDIVKDMPDYEYRQEILATFEETAEQIFRKFKEAATGKLKDPEKGHRYQIGVDLGRKTSYTVITVIDEMTDPYEVVYWDRFKTVDWSLQKKRIKEVWDKYPALRLRVDSTGLGDPVEEDLLNYGIRTEPFVYNEKNKKQLIDKLAIFIQEGKIIYPEIKELLNEMETFGREISKESGRVKYKAMGKFLDDCVHSLALAVWALLDKPRKVKKDEDEDKKKNKPINEITGY